MKKVLLFLLVCSGSLQANYLKNFVAPFIQELTNSIREKREVQINKRAFHNVFRGTLGLKFAPDLKPFCLDEFERWNFLEDVDYANLFFKDKIALLLQELYKSVVRKRLSTLVEVLDQDRTKYIVQTLQEMNETTVVEALTALRNLFKD